MEIISAQWEKRNLGRNAYEIVLSANDRVDEFLVQEKCLIDDGVDYLVVKVPVNSPEFLVKLPIAQYLFMETSFRLSLPRESYRCPSPLVRLDRDISVREISASESRSKIYEEIRSGIFTTDRIALDPHFSQQVSNSRYANWIEDVVQQGGKVYEVYSKESAIGFFVLKKLDEKRMMGVLSGTYKSYRGSGFGALLMKKLCETVWQLGFQWYYAVAVSNNMEALRANMIFGATIESASYTFVKHVIRTEGK